MIKIFLEPPSPKGGIKDKTKKILFLALNLFYPNKCLHCLCTLQNNCFYFCKKCIIDFSLVYPKADIEYFAVFEKDRAIVSFIKEIRNLQILGLIKIAAAFMVIQLIKLGWDMPDVIVPMSKRRFIKDHIYYIAKEIARFLNKTVSKESSPDQIALFVDDVMNVKKFDEMKNKLKFKKTYYMSLCFDIFFDDFYLSK